METLTPSQPVTKDPQVELIELKMAVMMFCSKLEGVTVTASKPMLDAIINSDLYKQMKSLSKP